MAVMNLIKNAITSLGAKTKPAYPMIAVAITNGIFKPLTTLTDKKESKETKQYTALRELLTEVVAVPTYLTSNLLAEKAAEYFYKNNPQKLTIAKANLGFVGVCAAAIYIIPALCSLVVKPFTDMIFKKNKPEQQESPSLKPAAQALATPKIVKTNENIILKYPNMNTFVNRGGMKI